MSIMGSLAIKEKILTRKTLSSLSISKKKYHFKKNKPTYSYNSHYDNRIDDFKIEQTVSIFS